MTGQTVGTTGFELIRAQLERLHIGPCWTSVRIHKDISRARRLSQGFLVSASFTQFGRPAGSEVDGP
jgi:hypothetical protein